MVCLEIHFLFFSSSGTNNYKMSNNPPICRGPYSLLARLPELLEENPIRRRTSVTAILSVRAVKEHIESIVSSLCVRSCQASCRTALEPQPTNPYSTSFSQVHGASMKDLVGESIMHLVYMCMHIHINNYMYVHKKDV